MFSEVGDTSYAGLLGVLKSGFDWCIASRSALNESRNFCYHLYQAQPFNAGTLLCLGIESFCVGPRMKPVN
jgi:hypothetical protein